MASVKDLVGSSVRFESLFDEHSATYGKEAFKEKIFQDLMAKGEQVEIHDGDGDSDLIVRKIDQHESAGYNVFSNVGEYQTWLQQSLHDPDEKEILEALSGSGS